MLAAVRTAGHQTCIHLAKSPPAVSNKSRTVVTVAAGIVCIIMVIIQSIGVEKTINSAYDTGI
jgi:hypothetical protein